MTTNDVRVLSWSLYRPEPVIRHSAFSPVVADPVFLYPHESPDGRWHLFAHSAWGIHGYVSDDGIDWKDRGVRVRDAMRPHLYSEDGVYRLTYERYGPLGLGLSWIPGRRWKSRIEQRTSRDLVHWSRPRVLLEPNLEWHASPERGRAVGNPCLVRAGAEYRLYYSASLVRIPDCGFNEPESIGLAIGARPDGPFVPQTEPIMRPDPSDRWGNLSCGALKVLAVEDGFVAFQNGIYWDGERKRSGSAILILRSTDGIRWERLRPEPILAPAEGWMRSHVYACDAKPGPDGAWRMYFNARDDWGLWDGKENIGLAVGAENARSSAEIGQKYEKIEVPLDKETM